MKKRCLVLFALPEEMIPVAVKNMEVVSECIGVGKVDAALSALEAIEKHTPDLVVSMGTAGSVRCRVGDVVLCSEFVDRDLEKTGLSMLTCRMRTFGGDVWYDTIYAVDGWQFQHHRTVGLRGHYRFLNPNGERIAWILRPNVLTRALQDYQHIL